MNGQNAIVTGVAARGEVFGLCVPVAMTTRLSAAPAPAPAGGSSRRQAATLDMFIARDPLDLQYIYRHLKFDFSYPLLK